MSVKKVSGVKQFLYFFPFQLVIVHLKHNQILLLFWLFLAGCITGKFFEGYGVMNLFLYPEYLGRIDFISHAVLGFSLGGLIMAFNISGYVLHGSKFPILATLNKPFTKYCLNNFIIPLLFISLYSYRLYHYQRTGELDLLVDIVIHLLGFYFGLFMFIFFTITYFFTTNQSLAKIFGETVLKKFAQSQSRPRIRPVKNVFSRPEKWYSFLTRDAEWKVVTYLNKPYKISLARDIRHYDQTMLRTVFAQNHINASLFEVLTVISIIFFSLFREMPLFQLPAAASVTLMLTLILMLSSAIYSWLKGWSTLTFIALFLLYNYVSQHPDYSFKSYGYGLKYSGEKAPYNIDILDEFTDDPVRLKNERDTGNEILLKRISRLNAVQGEKPKLIFINCSGGGLRATMWTFKVMQHLDSLLQGELMTSTHLITGSSGGMLGAAYFRELYLRSLIHDSIDIGSDRYLENIGGEILNNVTLSFALHDWLIRTRKFEYAGEQYTKDRGYSFERQFSRNTGGILDKKISDYRDAELNTDIPMLILSPTITNDGRRLLISPLSLNYLTQSHPMDGFHTPSMIESVDYGTLLEAQNADSLSFLSALRMSSTFFYVLPNVSLPTEPAAEVFDAGVRDNNGIVNTLRFLNAHREFLENYTSGAVIIQIHDQYGNPEIKPQPARSLIKSLTGPFEDVYGNYLNIQNYDQNEVLIHADPRLKADIQLIRYSLIDRRDEQIALSWRLTRKEKKRIKNAVNRRDNKTADSILLEALYRKPR